MPSQFVSLMISSHYIVLLALRHCTSGEEHSHLPCSNPIPFILMAFTADREDFCSHIPSLPWIFFFFVPGSAHRVLLKKLWEKRNRTLKCRWRPAKSSVELTAGFVATLEAQSASRVTKQRPLKTHSLRYSPCWNCFAFQKLHHGTLPNPS